MGGLNQILANLGITTRDLILDLLSAAFIADFGIVQAVGAGGATVDVEHAIQPVVAGEQQGTTITKGVEVLWPGGGGQLSAKWDLAVGDPVLLVGLKDFIPTVGGALPQTEQIPIHYTQETMKAIPMGAYKGTSAIPISVSGGVMTVGDPATAQPSARKGDAVRLDQTTDQVGMVMLAGMLGIPSLAGVVDAGSAKVKVS
jgi:hypothetical protein